MYLQNIILWPVTPPAARCAADVRSFDRHPRRLSSDLGDDRLAPRARRPLRRLYRRAACALAPAKWGQALPTRTDAERSRRQRPRVRFHFVWICIHGMPVFCAGEFVLLAQKSGVVLRILLTLWELPKSTRPHIMGIYLLLRFHTRSET